MHATATVMTLAGAAAFVAIARGGPAALPTALAAGACALALWLAAATGWVQLRGIARQAAGKAAARFHRPDASPLHRFQPRRIGSRHVS